MRHRDGVNRLDRRAGHRKALKNNMVTSLFRYERIETTKAKALVVRSFAEKMITRAKVDSVHNRRILARFIHDGGVLAKLFTEIGPRYVERHGGYTRILKLGRRPGDAAEMVFLELVDRVIVERKRPEKEAATEELEPTRSGADEAGETESDAESPSSEAEVDEKADIEDPEEDADKAAPEESPST
jgi:large subunit ribosomal protein L17